MDELSSLSVEEKRQLAATLLRKKAKRAASEAPLSAGQRALWFLQHREPESCAYNVGFAARVRSEVDASALQTTFELLAARHAALRTTFVLRDGDPLQRIAATGSVDFSIVDASPLDERELEARVTAAYRLPFDLERGPLVRVSLFTRAPREHVLLLVMHHIAVDAWAARLLVDELAAIYPAMRAGRPVPLAPPRRQYADVVRAQAEALGGTEGERLRDYWMGELADPLPAPIRFRGFRDAATMRGATHAFAFDDALLQRLRTARGFSGATTYAILLAAWMALLHRLTRQNDLLMALPMNGRHRADVADVVGYFINPIALRLAVDGATSFGELVDRVRDKVLAGFEHQDYPFALLAQELRARRGSAAERLTSVAFNFQKLQRADGLLALTARGTADLRVDVGGLLLEPYPIDSQEGQFDLLLELGEDGDVLFGRVKYNADAIDASTVERLAARYAAILDRALADPAVPLADLTAPLPPPIDSVRADDAEGPLSPHQERLWFIDRFETGNVYETSPTYHNLPLILEWDRAVDESALRALIARHPMLRARITRRGDAPAQRIEPGATVPFEVVDGIPPLDRILDRARIPFRLEDAPLARATVFRGDGRSVLLLTVHHIIADRRSLRLLADDLVAIQNGRTIGVDDASYPAHAKALRALPADERLADWEYELRGPLPVVELPLDRPRAAVHTYTAARTELTIDAETLAALDDLATRLRCERRPLLLAAVFALLHRYTGQNDLVIGTTVESGRSVGPWSNLLPLRCAVRGSQSFEELAAQVARTLARAQRTALPFDRLVQELALPKDMSRTALFDVLVDIGDAPAPHWPGVTWHETNVGFGKYDLHLFLQPDDAGLHGHLTYNADLYDAARIERLAAHFVTLLRALATTPRAAIGAPAMLGDDEVRRQVVDWNGAEAAYPAASILDLFAECVRRGPDRIALTAGNESLTYAELDRRAARLAGHLAARGATPGSLVAIHFERSADVVVTILAVLKAGCGYLPLETGQPRQRLQSILADAAPSLVVTRGDLASAAAPHPVVLLDAEAAAIADAAPLTLPRAPEQVAYCIYTSGSTGRPKGVLVEDRQVVRLLVNDRLPFALSENDVWTLFHSFSFDFSVWELYGALFYGGRAVIVPGEIARDPGAFRELLLRERVTVLNQTPGYFALLSSAMLRRPVPVSLRYVIFGGEALRPSTLAEWHAAHPAVTLVNMYGITETTVHVTFKELGDDDLRRDVSNIGRAIPTTTVYLLDEHGNLLPEGCTGELHVGGDGVARGYLNRPELRRFLDDPFRDGGRMYRSGDLARYLPNGDLEYLGRRDDQVKIRGYRVETGEIVAALAHHPGVAASTVVARGEQLVAYVVPAERGAPPRVEELLATARQTLPDYMIPSSYVVLDALPLTSNGKIDVKALPEPGAPASSSEYAPPRSEAERIIANAWRDALQAERVGLDDNFFDLGAHSLLVVRVHETLQRTFGSRLTIVDMFRHPTVRALALHLSDRPAAPVTAREEREPLPSVATGEYEPIAIIGMACRYPRSENLETFWENLAGGRECVTFFSDDELRAAGVAEEMLSDPQYIKASAVIDDIESFDALFFGYSAREAELIDPQQRVFLECAWSALEHAGYAGEREGLRAGVFAGAGMDTYLVRNLVSQMELSATAATYLAMVGNEKDFLPARVSYKLNLTGPSVNIQTACSTSLVAVHTACKSLQNRECDLALAGGVSVRTPHRTGYLYENGMILSPDGHCRAFDARAQGTLGGNGAGVVVLKRLRDALADGDTIHAVLRGTAVTNDGSLKIGFTAPGVRGQSSAVREAMRLAGTGPADISYIETHGTGTVLGDPIEIQALTQVYGDALAEKVPIGSVKTNIGHTDTAAGVAGLIKTVLALEHGEIPPSLNFEIPNPKIDFERLPFYVNTARTRWPRRDRPRRAGVSSFGLGGTNAHAIVEEAPLPRPPAPSRPWHLLTLSARTRTALDAATADLADFLKRNPGVDLADVAYTLHVGRALFPHRRALVCQTVEEAIAALESRDPEKLLGRNDEQRDRAVALLISGHGGHHVQMAREVYDSEPLFRAELDRCAELLLPEIGVDLREALFGSDDELLTRISVSQPAMFAVEYALAKLLESWGIRPRAMLGHSSGEYVAACIAGVLSLEDALALVVARGTLMLRLARGTMLSVALSEADVAPLLGPDVSLAVINSPTACVLSGAPDVMEPLRDRLTAGGVDCRELKVPVAGHSHMMDTIVPAFTERTRTIVPSKPGLRYLSNVTGDWISEADATDPTYWTRHLRQTVRFSQGLEKLFADPEQVLLEVGPGGTLSMLARNHPARDRNQLVVSTLRHATSPPSDTAYLPAALAKLWLAGVPIDWRGFHAHEQRTRVPLPTYRFDRQRYWIEPGKRVAEQRSGRNPDLADWFYAPVWKQSPPAAAEPARPRRCAIVEDDRGVAPVLARELAAAGHEVVALDGAFDCVIDLRHLTDPDEPFTFDAIDASLDRFHGAVSLARDIVNRRRDATLVVVANGLHDVTGGEILRPDKAPLTGPCRVIPQEVPSLRCLTIDIGAAPAEAAARAIVAELARVPRERAVAWRGARRWVQIYEPVRLPPTEPRLFHEGGVYLITGGMGAIGLDLAEALAGRFHAKLVLVGRTSADTADANDPLWRRKRERLEQMRTVTDVWTVAADVADEARMREIVAETERRFGAIDGVIHAAGDVRRDLYRTIHEDDRAHCEQQFRPKIHGTLVLARILAERDVKFCLLLSSMASVLGGLGFTAYAAANAFLDAFAELGHGHTRWMAVNLDGWLTEDRKDDVSAIGQELRRLAVMPHEGVEAVQRIVAGFTGPRVLLTTGDLQHRIDEWLTEPAENAAETAATASRPAHARPELSNDYVAPRNELETRIAAVWQQVLALDRVGIYDNFFELGGTSLIGVQIVSRLNRELDRNLSVARLFEGPTVSGIARLLNASEDEPSPALDERRSRGVRRRQRRMAGVEETT